MNAIIDWVAKASSRRDFLKLGLAYGSVILVLIASHQVLRMQIVEKVYPETLALKKVKLMDHEKDIMMMMPAITTITTYKAKRIPKTFLKQKLAQLFRKNPWLCGRILKNATDGIHLGYPESINNPEQISKLLKEHMQVLMDFDMPENLSYEEMLSRVEHLQVKKGNECINKPYALLFRITLLKIKGRDEIAVVLSMSHVLGDGHTYYKIMSMLDNTTKVTPLIVERSVNYNQEAMKLLGPTTSQWLQSPFLLLGLISCAIIRSSMNIIIVKVDNDWIARQKVAYKQTKESLADKEKEQQPEYVSTNDIISSWLYKESGCDFGLMSLNTRNRVPAFTEEMVGNYESSVLYPTRADCDTPGAIRLSLQRGFRSASGTAPGVLKTLNWNAALVTNWSTFYKQIDISDYSNKAPCRHIQHLPIAETGELAVWREGAVIFNIDANTTGLFIATRSITAQRIEASGIGSVLRML
mmetsp:Transcript_125566/g.246068  ORF Transcript_125566/g.246068 Transcript_125566/m.246068 type:complete len:469 (+) Transcript_125566:54-1460(+)